jgi:hypothetical protein
MRPRKTTIEIIERIQPAIDDLDALDSFDYADCPALNRCNLVPRLSTV